MHDILKGQQDKSILYRFCFHYSKYLNIILCLSWQARMLFVYVILMYFQIYNVNAFAHRS